MGIAFALYDSDDCPLPSGRVQLDDLGWIASILGIGGLVGTVAGEHIAYYLLLCFISKKILISYILI